jgi:hypothetical protein
LEGFDKIPGRLDVGLDSRQEGLGVFVLTGRLGLEGFDEGPGVLMLAKCLGLEGFDKGSSGLVLAVCLSLERLDMGSGRMDVGLDRPHQHSVGPPIVENAVYR